MEYTEEMCLGWGCKYYARETPGLCFHAGFLPKCSPELKAKRKRLDASAPKLYEALKAAKTEIAAYMCDVGDTNINPTLQSIELALAQAEVK